MVAPAAFFIAIFSEIHIKDETKILDKWRKTK